MTRNQQIVSRLSRDKRYRDAFVDSEIAVGIPFQIRAMREKRGWTQQELGERTNKRQSVISQLENPGYGKLTLSTLKSLASAFDVGLTVRFAPFSELIARAANLSEEDVAVPSFSEDKGLYQIRLDSTFIEIRETFQISNMYRDDIYFSTEPDTYKVLETDEVSYDTYRSTNTGTANHSNWRSGNTDHLLQ